MSDANFGMETDNGGDCHQIAIKSLNKRPFEKNAGEELSNDAKMDSTDDVANSSHLSEENKFYCSICSLKLNNDNDAKLHYVGKKHKKALTRDETRRKLESRSVFMYGSNDLTKLAVEEYFKKNFASVADVKMNESRHTCAIIEFADEETAQKVLTKKKHLINNFWFVTKPRKLPIDAKILPQPSSNKDVNEYSKVPKCAELEQILKNLTFDKVEELHESLKLNDDDVQKRISIAKDLTETLKNFIRGDFAVELYGSSVNGFGWKDSDLDMTLLFHDPTTNEVSIRSADELKNFKIEEISNENHRISYAELKSLPLSDCVRLLKKLLAVNEKNKNLQFVDGIRCPLLLFSYENDYVCELSFENRLASNNSNWLKFLASKFPFLTRFSSVLRLWANKTGLLLKYRSCFNGYTLVLMLITFLQSRRLLPTVDELRQSSDSDRKNVIDGWNCDWHDTVEALDLDKKEPSLDALRELFDFLSSKTLRFYIFLPRVGQIVCVDRFLKENCTKADAAYHRSVFPLSEINIQDPFVLDHNIALKIAPKFVQMLKHSAQCVTTACNGGETVAKALVSNFKAETSSDELFFESKILENVATYSFVLKPTLDELKRLAPVWLVNFVPKWTRKAVEAIRKILIEVMFLDLNPVRQETASICDSPDAKRAKIESESVVELECKTNFCVWTNRKRFQQDKNLKTDLDLLEMEKEISSKVLEEERKTLNSQPLSFVLRIETVIDDDLCALKLNISCGEKAQFGRFTTCCTFFRSFVRKILPHILKV